MVENRVERIPRLVPVKKVLISVFDKSNLETLVKGLVAAVPDLQIFSTGGTFRACEDILRDGFSGRLVQVSDYTGQPEMHGGLVKTLDFKIYLGLLSEPYNQLHDQDLKRAEAVPIDMVVANLYPFSQVVATEGTDCENARSNIDIGGPCMLRAAAKNFIRVAAVCDPADYPGIIEEIDRNKGCLTAETRFSLAKKAFSHTADYDDAVRRYLRGLESTVLADTYEMSDDGNV